MEERDTPREERRRVFREARRRQVVEEATLTPTERFVRFQALLRLARAIAQGRPEAPKRRPNPRSSRRSAPSGTR